MPPIPPVPPLPADLADLLPADELLAHVLDVSLAGIAVYQPIFAPNDATTIVDFRFVFVNPAAQRILNQPARPTASFLEAYPHTRATGVFDLYCAAFRSRQPEHYEVDYRADGLDSFFRIAVRRVGPLLLASFTDTTDSRTATEDTLRASYAREKAALDQVFAQRNLLQATLQQAPAALALFEGPEQRITLVNARMCAIWDRPEAEVLGRPLLEALPELRGQGFDEQIDQVFRTGQPYVGTETPARLLRNGQLQTSYYNFVYQPFYDEQGTIRGVVDVAVEVTEQVLARKFIEDKEREMRQLYRQSDDINEELAAANEELQAANEEILANNQELYRTEQSLRELNQELEARVADRTQRLLLAQAEAERQRTRLESFFMQAPAAICVYDGPEFVYEMANHVYQALFPNRLLRGLPLARAVPEIVGQPAWLALQEVYTTGISHAETALLVPLLGPGGEPVDRYFDFIYQPRFAGTGTIDGVLVFAFEVTEQVQARQQNAAQQEQLRTLFEQAPVAIAVFQGPDHVVELANPSICTIWGRTPAQVLGLPMLEAIPETEAQGFGALLDGVYRTGVPYVAQEHPVVLRRGGQNETLYLNFVYQPMRDPGGLITGITVVATDVTEQFVARQQVALANDELRVSNAALDSLNQQLTRTNQDLDNFVYTASHDLKQPVDNMAGLFEELKHGATFHDPQAKLMVQMFEEALQQIDGTIRGLTAVVQTERQSSTIPTEVVALAPLVQSVLQSLHHQATDLHAEFGLDFTALPTVLFARLNLQSILYNLLSNALKYAHPDRPPRVLLRSARTPDGQPLLLVQDNGLGLDVTRHGTELFQMFRRFHDHTPGSGMGLYLVNRILRQAGGRIEVESTVGEGSTFRVYLPASASPGP